MTAPPHEQAKRLLDLVWLFEIAGQPAPDRAAAVAAKMHNPANESGPVALTMSALDVIVTLGQNIEDFDWPRYLPDALMVDDRNRYLVDAAQHLADGRPALAAHSVARQVDNFGPVLCVAEVLVALRRVLAFLNPAVAVDELLEIAHTQLWERLFKGEKR